MSSLNRLFTRRRQKSQSHSEPIQLRIQSSKSTKIPTPPMTAPQQGTDSWDAYITDLQNDPLFDAPPPPPPPPPGHPTMAMSAPISYHHYYAQGYDYRNTHTNYSNYGAGS
ncbi:uncharacterized protein VTP21DRAFT_3418 [Calcarisporiella thermophila]|uniref:uncharacterized protein n=1 Tax=Calcarisporiella thermophila TaxID=911321 RepID=UPI003743F0C8